MTRNNIMVTLGIKKLGFSAGSAGKVPFRSLAILILLLTLIVPAAGYVVSAQQTDHPWREVRTLDMVDYGLSDLDGMAFSPDANSFLLLQKDGSLAGISMNEVPVDMQGLTVPAQTSQNVAFNNRTNKLFVLSNDDTELAEISVDEQGLPVPDAGAIREHSLDAVNLQAARGITFDAATGRMFVLHADGDQMAIITPDASGSYEPAPGRVSRVNLSGSGAVDLQGIAFNPQTGNIYLLDAAEQRLYEITVSGSKVNEFDLRELGVSDPKTMVFAPSVDRTDDPDNYNLTILYEASIRSSKLASAQQTDSTMDRIVEVSLAAPAALPGGTPIYPATLVRKQDLSNATWNPSSPDTSGIDYWPAERRFLITDSEVEEEGYWQGFNVFSGTTAGVQGPSCTTHTPSGGASWNHYSPEPTGLAINPVTNRIYIASDSGAKLFEINIGPDNEYCTSDDIVTTITIATDLEDVAYGDNTLFIGGGVDAEIFWFTLGANQVIGGGDDGPLNNFDTARWGFTDVEGIGYNSDSGNILISGAQGSGQTYIAEVSTANGGTLMWAYNVFPIMGNNKSLHSDIAYAPSSVNPSINVAYIVSRGVDNGADPNENDGQWWEINIGSTPSTTSTPSWTPTSGPSPTASSTPTHTNTPPPAATSTVPPGASTDAIYVSFSSSGTVSGVAFADEDILRFDGNAWSLFFDGSDVGVTADAFGFEVIDESTFLINFNGSVTLNGTAFTPNDIAQFNATSMGSTTAGTFSMYFDGSDVGLTTSAEYLDSLNVLPDGRVLISTTGNPSVPGVTGNDEDILAFTPTMLGNNTSGTWELYFDGSDVGLADSSSEDVDALEMIEGNLYLSTSGNFTVNGVSGNNNDVFICSPTSLGGVTACVFHSTLYFDGSTWGLGTNNLDAFSFLMVGPPPTATNTNTPSFTPTPFNTPTITFTPMPTFTFTPTSTPTVGPPPANTPTVTATYTPTNTPLPTHTATATNTPTPTATGGPPSINLLVNSSFELDDNHDGLPDFWTNNGIFSRTSELVRTGSYSAKFASSSNASANILQTVSNLTAGATYDISGWVNIPQPAGSSLSFQIKVEWRNGSNLIYRDTVKKYTGVTNGWNQASASLVAPAGTTNARLLLALNGLNGTIYVEDFSFGP